jgi:hypothetical protein
MADMQRMGAIAGGAALLLASSALAIDISPSKPEGGAGGAKIYPESDPKESSKPSLLQNPFKWIFGKSDLSKRVDAPPEFDVDIQVGKKSYSSMADDAIEVKMTLRNKGENKYIMKFPSAQHYDFIVENETKQECYRWSADKEFATKLSTIIVNPNEKLTYPGQEPLLIPLNLGGRELPPGQYRLVGVVTAEKPISVSTTFEVARENSSSAAPGASNTDSASPGVPALPVDESLLER